MDIDMPASGAPSISAGLEEPPSAARLVRSTKVWYNDGNLVLRAEDTLFKVHRDVLSARSDVFAGMLAVSQPDNSDQELVDGCPIVHLPGDESYDVSHALRAIYGARRYASVSPRLYV
jgi:hypothetical protein